ncbi:MAG: CheR family methyltransferase [Bacillota bacterium]
MISLSNEEFRLMQRFICDSCGILITKDKSYLIESRLQKIIAESGSRNFLGLYNILKKNNITLIQKVIDAITTNETHWFRDRTPWEFFEEALLPEYISQIRKGLRSEVRIWSTACSTGQEPYSVAMCIKKYINKRNIKDIDLGCFKILATDISQKALNAAIEGNYDNISVSRGLNEEYKNLFFIKKGNRWFIDEVIKKAVVFKYFNLISPFVPLGKFDVVFCRYVLIYFSEDYRKNIIERIVDTLVPDGILFLGNSELLPEGSQIPKLHRKIANIYYKG